MSDLRNQLDQILTARLGDHSVTDRVLDEIWEALYPLRRELLDYQQGNTKLQAINQQRHEGAQRANERAAKAEAALGRVREMHSPDEDGDCCGCREFSSMYIQSPCDTIRALDGDGQ